ncbi:MAG TPA: cbb3-type cytochrome oxidase assembly protein CcoS [Noviherbaspirillum sp.]|uniref:cbb3-type cytochrome oxidase assembly protein CcoS n=1 Tax=Noviherbaspirillum sp. TaxID=1926288 RepID=UPI002B46B226|nr:cbb3-type cytochrome oxidase assembly protein CcoS [Noviherbaspirillum sp.]HJV85094.1 cbb3-type cytochrome oxidase assembly protein CcoS [Noviherbaspirillum sp.]
MEALYLLVPLSIVVVFAAIWIFFAASDNGQFDDLVGPGLRILQDDDRPAIGDEADGKRHDVNKQ